MNYVLSFLLNSAQWVLLGAVLVVKCDSCRKNLRHLSFTHLGCIILSRCHHLRMFTCVQDCSCLRKSTSSSLVFPALVPLAPVYEVLNKFSVGSVVPVPDEAIAELSENFCRWRWRAVYRVNRKGARTVHCGPPFDRQFWVLTFCGQLVRLTRIQTSIKRPTTGWRWTRTSHSRVFVRCEVRTTGLQLLKSFAWRVFGIGTT